MCVVKGCNSLSIINMRHGQQFYMFTVQRYNTCGSGGDW